MGAAGEQDSGGARGQGGRLWRRARVHLGVFAGFCVLSAAYFWYVIPSIGTHVAGFPQDAFVFLWNQRWVSLALAKLHQNPYVTDWIFHPVGAPLYVHTLTPLNGAAAIPLYALGLPSPLIYNLLLLLTFALTGYGMWLLVVELTGSRLAGVVGGVSFAFCANLGAHAQGGQVNLVSVPWMPLYLVFLVRSARRAGWVDPVLAGVFLLFQALSHYEYAFYLLLLTPVALAGAHLAERISWKPALARLAAAAAVCAVGVSPLLAGALGSIRTEGSYHVAGEAAWFSADLASFFIPPPTQLLRGGEGPGFAAGGLAVEGVVYLGMAAMLLGAAGLALELRRGAAWAAGCVLFGALSLGPVMTVGGREVGRSGLYELLATVPGASGMRAPARFAVGVSLCLAVLVGFVVKRLSGKLGRRRAWVAALGLMALLGADSYLRWGKTEARLPAGYRQVLAADPSPAGVLAIPCGVSDGVAALGPVHHKLAYYAIEAGKKAVAGGFVTRVPPSRLGYFVELPLIRQLFLTELGLGPSGRELEERARALRATSEHMLVEELGVRYVAVHLDLLGPQAERTRRLLELAFPPMEELYADGRLIIYRLVARR